MSPHDESLPAFRFAVLSDDEIADALEALRTRESQDEDDVARTIAYIVDLELEATRRGIAIESPRERMPPNLALVRCRAAIDGGDVEGATRLMWHLHMRGAWEIYRHTQATCPQPARMLLQLCLLFVMDTYRIGLEAAEQRRRNLDASTFDDAQLLDYVEHCILAHFTLRMATGPGPF